MKKLAGVFMLAFLFALSASAQSEAPRVEAFGGYSALVLEPANAGVTWNGWNASLAGNPTSWLGIVGDFSGHYGRFEVAPGTTIRANVHSFLFGPRFSYRTSRVTPFAHVLAGATRADVGVFGLSVSTTAFTAAVGGGLDINASDAVAIRIVQADYLATRFGDATQNNVRLSFGVVFRF